MGCTANTYRLKSDTVEEGVPARARPTLRTEKSWFSGESRAASEDRGNNVDRDAADEEARITEEHLLCRI